MSKNQQLPMTVIKNKLTSIGYLKEIKAALGKNRNAEKYIRGVLTTVSMSDKLQECEITSIMKCCLTSAQLGIEVDAKGHGYLVPFFNKDKGVLEAQFIPGYKGYISKAFESKRVKVVYTYPVYKGDTFNIQMGTSRDITHVPYIESNYYGLDKHVNFVYAVINYTNGDFDFEVMTKAQIEKNIPLYKGKWPIIWVKSYGEMSKKTVIKRLFKRIQLPQTEDLIQLDTYIDQGRHVNIENGKIKPGKVIEVESEDIPNISIEEIESNLKDYLKFLGWNQNKLNAYIKGVYPGKTYTKLTLSEKEMIMKKIRILANQEAERITKEGSNGKK